MLHKKVMGIALAGWMALSGCTVAMQPEAGMSGESTPVPQEEVIQEEVITPANVQAEFVLPDGTSCLFAGTGATLAFDDKRVNYTCEPLSAVEGTTLGLLGDPTVAGPTEYSVELATIGRNSANDGFELRASEVITFTAWEVALVDGRLCLHAGFGATMGFDDGQRLNYTCDKGDSTADEVGLMDELVPQGEGLWLAWIDEIGRIESGFEQLSSTQVPVAKISGAEVVQSRGEGRGTTEEGAAVDDELAEHELVGTTWQWVQTEYGDGSLVTVNDPSRYALTFNADGTLTAQVDCNGGSGTYTLDGASLTFGPLVTTRMGCPPGSQGGVFTKDLAAVSSYVLEDGNLHLALTLDSGIMEFAPAQ